MYIITEKADHSNGYIAIFRNKIDNSYSFINLEKNTISPCKFRSEGAALNDLKNYISNGKLLKYVIVDERTMYKQLAFINRGRYER